MEGLTSGLVSRERVTVIHQQHLEGYTGRVCI